MCRWIAYRGDTIALEHYVTAPAHSLIEQSRRSIPRAFLVVLTFWLIVIFCTLGLFSPRNGTAYTIIFVCALSVATAIFLVLELDQPFEGVLQVSDLPVRGALVEISR